MMVKQLWLGVKPPEGYNVTKTFGAVNVRVNLPLVQHLQSLFLNPQSQIGGSRDDPRSSRDRGQHDRPGAQTLAELKREAGWYKSTKQGREGTKSKSGKSRNAVAKSNKIMREELFGGITWTRAFVSGPIDNKWNPYNFYCQMYKDNTSIYDRGAKDIL